MNKKETIYSGDKVFELTDQCYFELTFDKAQNIDVINLNSITSKIIVFKNIINRNLKINISNLDCEKIEFKSININCISIYDGIKMFSLDISDCNILEFEINNHPKINKLLNINSIFISKSIIEFVKFRCIDVSQELSMSGILGLIEIFSSEFNTFKIKNSEFKENTNNNKQRINGEIENIIGIYIYDCLFRKLNISSIKYFGFNLFNIQLINTRLSSLDNLIDLPDQCRLDIIRIIVNTILEITSISEISRKNIEIGILSSTDSEGLIIFDSININELNLSGINNKLTLIWSNVSINSLTFTGYINQSLSYFNSCHFNKFDVISSDLTNLGIYNPLSIDKINLSNSNISGLKIIGNNIFKLKTYKNEDVSVYYRQLKISSKNSQNNFLESEYKRLEYKYKKIPLNFNDFVIRIFNSMSGYGTSWLKSSFWIFILNFVIWISFCYSSYNIVTYDFDFFVFISNIKYFYNNYFLAYYILLNPLSRYSEIKELLNDSLTLSSFSYLLFLMSKAINSILLYQLVQSLRKH